MKLAHSMIAFSIIALQYHVASCSSLPPNFSDKSRYYEEADKVYCGVVTDIIREVQYDNFPDGGIPPNVGQYVEIDVYLSWKGDVADKESLFYYRDSHFVFQPLLKVGSTILVFANNRFKTLAGFELTSEIGQGSVQEFEFGSGGIESLLNIRSPKLHPLGKSENYFSELRLSDKWSWNKTLGVIFSPGIGWVVSEKLGWIFISEEPDPFQWFYSLDLGWFLLDQHKGWIWSLKEEQWYYVYEDNMANFFMWLYDLSSDNWFLLNRVFIWDRIGFLW